MGVYLPSVGADKSPRFRTEVECALAQMHGGLSGDLVTEYCRIIGVELRGNFAAIGFADFAALEKAGYLQQADRMLQLLRTCNDGDKALHIIDELLFYVEMGNATLADLGIQNEDLATMISEAYMRLAAAAPMSDGMAAGLERAMRDQAAAEAETEGAVLDAGLPELRDLDAHGLAEDAKAIRKAPTNAERARIGLAMDVSAELLRRAATAKTRAEILKNRANPQ